MANRSLITLGIIALFLVILLNVVPLFWKPTSEEYIAQDHVEGMALVVNRLPYTLNFDQQKNVIDILNRALPVLDYRSTPQDPPLFFESIVIYRFDQKPITVKPLAWVNENLVFSVPEWSEGYLMEVSKRELYEILNNAYDKNLPKTTPY